ncbi:hypothetical protein JXJ21_06330 [candidate division KSB1 bacterium]|nr:hypothetical protein [candidate division KSB1 bacterium]
MRIMKSNRTIWIIAAILCFIHTSYAGTLGNVRAIPDDSKAGATSIYYFSFTTSNNGNGDDVGLPSDGKIEITFPNGFTTSTILFAASQNAKLTGGFSDVSVAGQVLTLQRDSTGNHVAGNIGVLVGAANVINPASVNSYTMSVRTLTATNKLIDSGISLPFSIQSGELDHFSISKINSQTAGLPFDITLTAQDKHGNTVTSYNGTVNLNDLTGTMSPMTTGNFSSGRWTGTVSMLKSISGNKITAIAIGKSGESNSFNVTHAALHHFTFASITSPQEAGSAFPIVITAEDEFGNRVTGFTGRPYLSDDTGSITPARTGGFSAGTWSGQVQITKSQNDITITATYSGITGLSNSFNVQPGALTQFQIAPISTQAAGIPFAMTVTAMDAYSNQVTQFDETVEISDLTGTISPGISGKFNFGMWSNAVRITQVRSGNRISVQIPGGGSSGTSNAFDVIASTIDHFDIAPIASPQTAGNEFSLAITAKDAQNNTVTSFTGTAALSDLTGTVSPQTTANFSAGQWSGNVNVTRNFVNNVITVTSSGKAGTSNAFVVNPASLDHFSFSSISSPQTAGQVFNISITARDAYENVVTSFNSSVDLIDNTGTISPAKSGSFTSGTWSGGVRIIKSQNDIRITASANSRTGVSSTFNVAPASLHHFTLQSISTQAAGVPFSIAVSALDAYDNIVTNFTNTVNISDLTGTLAPVVSNNFSNGQWSGSVSISQARTSNRITVTRTGGTETGSSNSFDVIATSIDHFEISSISGTKVAGQNFTITITAKDAQNNTVTGFSGTANLRDVTGTLTPSTTTNFTNGIWSGTVQITRSISSDVITVTSSGKAGNSNNFAVAPAALDHFRFESIDSPQTAGQPFAISLVAEDVYENQVTSFSSRVNLSDATGTINPGITGTFTAGSWSGQVTITRSQEDDAIIASWGNASGQSNPFNIKSAALKKFVINTLTSQFAGQPFSLTVTAKDEYNNTVNSFADKVTISDLTGTITPALSGDFNSGVWSDNVLITQARTNNIISVKRQGGNESGTSNSFDVLASAVDHFEINTIASPQTAGNPFNITITAKDKQNNVVTDYAGTATLSDLTGTIAPKTTGAFQNGIRVESVTITMISAVNAITITSAGKAGTSNNFIVNHAELDHFTFSEISSPRVAATAFGITITAEDVFNNQVKAFTGKATLSDNTGTLSPQASGSFSNGRWTGDVTISMAQNDVRITATGSGKSGSSNSFNVIAGELDHFTIDPVATQFTGEAFALIVTALDKSENRVTSFSGKVDITDKTGSIAPGRSDNFNAGQWIGNVTISQSFVDDVITVQLVGGAQIGKSNKFNVVAGSVDHFAIDKITAAQTAGKAFTIKVVAQDQDSNTVTSFNGQLNLSDLTGSITPVVTGNFVNGVWQDTVKILKSRLSNTITATNGNRIGVSNAFDVLPAALDHFQISPIQSPQSAGTPFSITITAVDKYENKVTGFANSAQLSVPGGQIVPDQTGNFNDGVWTGEVVIENTHQDIFILANYKSIIGQSNSFNVEPAAVHKLVVRNQPGGYGTEIGEVILTLDDKLHIYAAGYDRFGNYVRDVYVKWRSTGDLDAPEPEFGTQTTLDPVTPATSGYVVGDTSGVISDSTGLITVGSIDYVKIRTAAGNQGVELGNLHITTDDSLVLYAAGYDGGDNYLGEVSVFWETRGTLYPAVSDTATSLAYYPSKSNREGSIRISHATAKGDETGTIRVTAGKPVGNIELTAMPNTLPADGLSVATIRSNSILDSDGNWVDSTEYFTVTTTTGKIIAPPDASDDYDGWQVSPGDSGIIAFTFQTATHGGTAYISVNSVGGSASGTTIVNISSLNILKVYAENLTVSQKQVGVPVSVEVENVGSEGLSNISAGLKFTGPPPAFENRNLDYPVVSRTDRIKNIPGNSIQTLTFMVSVGTAALNDTISIDAWVSGNIGESVVSDSDAVATDYWIVQTPAKLSIQRIEAFADTVSQGLKNVSVSMRVENTGEASATITEPSLKFWSILENRYVPNDYEVFASPYNPEIIMGQGIEQLNFTLNVATTASLGKVRIDGLVSGADINSGLVVNDTNADTTDEWYVSRAPVVGITSFRPSQYYVTRGQTVPWTITMVVKNSAASPVRLSASELKFIFSGRDISSEYSVIKPFEFIGAGTADLAGGREDSLRFKIMKTGETLGPITVEGAIDLIDLQTMKSMHRSQTTGFAVQNPANLMVDRVILSQGSATVEQTIDWKIKVVVSNDGEGDITLDPSTENTNIVFNPSDGFIIKPPSGLSKSEDFVLRGSQVDTLEFTVDKTGKVLGWVNIIAHVGGVENNSGNEVHASSNENVRVKIEKPAQMQLYSVISKAPNAPYVNTSQNYQIQVRVQHPGDVDTDGVRDVRLQLTSDGASIDTVEQVISSVPAGSIRSTLFEIIAPSGVNPGEQFEAKIVDARSDNTGEVVAINPAIDSTETIITQKPANLKILDVIVPSAVFAGQIRSWHIYVVVTDSGGAELVLEKPAAQDIQVVMNDQLQKDYIIEPPSELSGGGLTLSGGEIDTLKYTVTNTGEKSGEASLKISLQAQDKNDLRNFSVSQSNPFYVQTSVKIAIEQTLLRGCNDIDEQRGRVNKGQTFRITAIIKSYGNEPVDDIYVQLATNGGSLIAETKSVIPTLDPLESIIDSVYYTIIADSIEGAETFTARIVSGTVRSSSSPAMIEPKYDSTAVVIVQEKALLQPEIMRSPGDNNLAVNQIVTIKTIVRNLGDAEVDSSGVIAFLAPESYRIITPAGDTTRSIGETLFLPDQEIVWRLITPDDASGPDLLILSISKVPNDLNSRQPAFINIRQDTFSVQIRKTKLFVNSFEIIAPEGANDGVLSTGQDFRLQAAISYSQNLSQLRATVIPPSNSEFIFPVGGQTKYNFESGLVQWDLRAPRNRSLGDTLRLKVSADENGKTILAEDSLVVISTIEKAMLRLNAQISDPPGAVDGTLSLGQPFEIKAVIENEGAAMMYGTGTVRLDPGVTGITILDSAVQIFEVGHDAKWRAIAPLNVTTEANIILNLIDLPLDENTNATASIVSGKDKILIPVRTEKLGSIKTNLSIHNPPGAKNGVLSTDQAFDIEATIVSEGVDSIRCELILPENKDFSLSQDESRIKRVSGTGAIRWSLLAPNDTAKVASFRMVTLGKDRNYDNKLIFGNTDTLTVSVIEKANLNLHAAIVSPDEALDNTVSPGTEFEIEVEAINSGTAQVYGRFEVELAFSDPNYTIKDSLVQSLEHGPVRWRIQSPIFKTSPKNITIRWKNIPRDINTDLRASTENQEVKILISTQEKSLVLSALNQTAPHSVVQGAKNVVMMGLLFENSEEGEFSSDILLHSLKLRLEDKDGRKITNPAHLISRLAVAKSSDYALCFAAAEGAALEQNPLTLQFLPEHNISSSKPDSLSLIVDIAENTNISNFKIKIDSSAWFDVIIDGSRGLRPLITDTAGKGINDLKLASGIVVILKPSLKSTFLNYPNPFGSSNKSETNFTYFLEKDADIELRIYSLIGELVWRASYSASDPQGRAGMHDKGNLLPIFWNGTNGRGHRVLNGVYISIFTTSYGETATTRTAVIK